MFHIDIITCCIASWERVPFPSFVITHHNIPRASFVPSQIFCSFHVKKRNLDLPCIFVTFHVDLTFSLKSGGGRIIISKVGPIWPQPLSNGEYVTSTKLIAKRERRRIFCQSQNFFAEFGRNTKWGGLRGGNMSPQTKLIKRKGENEKGKSQARTKIIPANFVVKLSTSWL